MSALRRCPVSGVTGPGQHTKIQSAAVASAATSQSVAEPRCLQARGAAVASMFGAQVRQKLTLGGDGGGVFDLDNRGAVTLTVTRVTTAGPPAAEVADALAGRSHIAAVLGDLPASSRAALSRMADFFNTPVQQSPA
jgi:hypothetical protein